MKTRHPLLLLAALALLNTGCDDDTALAPFTPVVFLEDFQEAEDGATLNIEEWGNFSEAGILWHEETYSGNGYAALENTSSAAITSWLVSRMWSKIAPKILFSTSIYK